MRYISVFILSFLLSACASTPSPSGASNVKEITELTSLPPQSLNPGDCGLFIWTSGERQSFIGFESQEGVKLLDNGQVVNASRQEGNDLGAEERIYSFGENESLKLTLRKETDITEGQRFIGRFTSKTDEGWERILPVVAVLSCLPEEAPRS